MQEGDPFQWALVSKTHHCHSEQVVGDACIEQ